MTVDQKRERLRELRDLPQPRSAAHQDELAALAKALQAVEAESLSGATQRMRQEREETEARTRSLERLATRRMALVARLEGALSETRVERLAIDAELASVLAGTSAHAPSNHARPDFSRRINA